MARGTKTLASTSSAPVAASAAQKEAFSSEGALCARCAKPVARHSKRRYCFACMEAFRLEAYAWQERDYLHAFLHTRDDETGRHLEHLRATAQRLGIDWAQQPPAPMTYDQRLAALTDRPQPKARKAKAGDAA